MTSPRSLPRCAVILSTYNAPRLLEKTLQGYESQRNAEFEVVIADDGSGTETRELIQRFQQRGRLDLLHIWHPDQGFRKTEILNRAIVATTADYLIFSDGDCIPSATFVADHLHAARPGHFIAGTIFRLAAGPTQAISDDAIRSQHIFSSGWLRQHGQPWDYKLLRLAAGKSFGSLLNRFTPTLLYWCGANASGWRTDILQANGFDERMKYGGEDKEFGERLQNAGITPLSYRYSLLCLHQDHGRNYVNEAARKVNLAIRAEVQRVRATRTEYGISQHENELHSAA